MSKLHPNRLAAFVREFGFLSSIPYMESVDIIKVARGDPALIQMTGNIATYDGVQPTFKPRSDGFETLFYAVSSAGVQRLEAAKVNFAGLNNDIEERTPADSNVVQLRKLGLRPDFIVCCARMDGAGGLNILTIYKMDKFDYDIVGIYLKVEDESERYKSDQEVERLANRVEHQDSLHQTREHGIDSEWSDQYE